MQVNMNNENREVTADSVTMIRQIIVEAKDRYMKWPTYVEVDWDNDLHELNEKRFHANWWEELTGEVDDDGWWQTYYYEMVERVADPRDAAMDILSNLLRDYEINAETLGDLAEECDQEIRQCVARAPLEEVQEALAGWLRWWPAEGLERAGCEMEEGIVSREAICERLEDCGEPLEDGICDHLGLPKGATYADAVKFAREWVKVTSEADQEVHG